MKNTSNYILTFLVFAVFSGCGKEEITKVTVKKVTPIQLDRTPPQGGPPPAESPDPGFKYEKPESWSDQGASGMRTASFTAGPEDATVAITVIRLGGAAGGLLPNVNRWRGQIGLAALAPEELTPGEIALGDATAQFVEMAAEAKDDSPALATLVAIQEFQGSSWFFKMTGPQDTVSAERTSFESFLKSVSFSP